ncbi:hypothetical protein FDECE_17103 [Fusarium decemcellulare]|nr:hypothetical protein FDECE_17103 [Fusarium decemcellulare]
MSQQPQSGPKNAQGKEEVSQATSEQEKQPQPTGAPTPGTDNSGTTAHNNDRGDADDKNNHNNDGGSTDLYELLLNAEDDDHAMRKLTDDWDQVKGMVKTHYRRDDNKTALHVSAEKGFKNVVEKLVAEGADVSASDENGWKPLHFACFRGHNAAVEVLLRSGASPEATDDHYRVNALHIAILCGEKVVVETLLKACPTLLNQQSTTSGWTPFMTAVKQKNEDIMGILINHIPLLPGRDQHHCLDICDDEQNTPLMVACESRLENSVKALCKARASGDIQDYVGRTALHYAVKSQQLAIAEILIDYTDSKSLLMTDNNGASAFDDVEFNLASGEQGPLNAFARLSGSLLVDRLIRDKTQREALDWAAQNTKRHRIFRMLVQSLLSKDASYEADVEDISAFEWAVRSRLPWVLGLLIDNFPAAEDLELIKNAAELAKYLRESKSMKKESKKLTPNDRGVGPDRSESDYENQILEDMQDYLSDFVRAETYKRTLFKPVKPRDGLNDVLPKFNVTITQFFARRIGEQRGRTRWIKHLRSVQEVIYDKGPARIARETMKRWLGRPQAEPKRPFVQQDDKEIETRLKWVHLPVTNIVWMEDLMKKILKEKKCPQNEMESLASFLRSSWVQVPDGTSASRCMRPLYVAKRADETTTNLISDSEKVTNSKNKIKEKPEGTGSRAANVSALYMPYLSFSKYSLTNSNDSSQREDLYNKLLDVYKEDPLHRSPTLDEAYYHFALDEVSKKEQNERNKDQVVTQELKEDKHSAQALTLGFFGLAAYGIPPEWVITATPHPVDENQEDNLPKDFLNHPSTQEQIREASPQSTFAAHIATLIANYCVDAYERKRTNKQEETTQNNDSSSSSSRGARKERSIRSIRQLFSDAVNRIAREEKTLFQDFNRLCGRNGPERTRDTSTGKVREPREDEISKAVDKKKSPTRDGDGDLKKVLTDASKLACDVKDIRDELNILRSIVNSQLIVQEDMAGNPESTSGITAHYFGKDIEELENVAKRVQESVSEVLRLIG